MVESRSYTFPAQPPPVSLEVRDGYQLPPMIASTLPRVCIRCGAMVIDHPWTLNLHDNWHASLRTT